MSQQSRSRLLVVPAVFVVIRDETGAVLLQRRAGTGYMDGFYDLPSGHLEPNETLQDGIVRETREEVGLTIDPKNLELFHVNQNSAEPDLLYMNFVFKASAWSGEPSICEPDKCDDVGFFALSKLPKITPQVRRVLSDISKPGVTFSYFTAEDFRPTVL